jgi:hypothetical protein
MIMHAKPGKRIGILDGLLILIGVVAGGFLIYQVWYEWNAVAALAEVQEVESRGRGRASVTVVYEREGKPVQAKLHIWTWLDTLEKRQRVPILYQPDKPSVVQMDSFAQRYLPALLITLFGGAIGVSALWRVGQRAATARREQPSARPRESSG